MPYRSWKWISYCGKNSIVFLCLNQLAILVVKKYIVRLNLAFPLDSIVTLFLVLPILLLLSKVFFETKLK